MVSLKEFAHPAFEIFSAVGTIGPTFFLAIAMFGFVFQISSLITEKELKLRQVLTSFSLCHSLFYFKRRAHICALWTTIIFSHGIFTLQAMTMMGLYDTAYWLSWLSWEGIITLISSLLTVLFGLMFQFDFFLHNSFAVVFLLFFLFQLNMVSFFFLV